MKRRRPSRLRHHQPAPNRRSFAWVAFPLIAILGFIAVSQHPALRRVARQSRFRLQAAIAHATGLPATVRLRVPFHRQEHPLSCEVAALKMALNYHGVAVEESQLLDLLPFTARNRRGANNIWGDPNVGFVGSINGKMPNTGYGVYERPIAQLAERYRPAKAIVGGSLTDLVEAVAGFHPVIVWGNTGSGRDISWYTSDGVKIDAIDGEHTRVVVGYTGTPSAPERVLLLDPIYGEVSMSREQFLADWGTLGNRAVIVR